ncbi:protein jag [Arcanobacterium bovis]|uniref:Single-stranded DNA-binding protein n=1 Tax=Arcanobacterium bovis TaxID=2529275 RepID=A0A4Q9UZ84_9ACTO|nr:R3H domain-containing nucleic acid-binding protein [Arcanobacterium bovis]TBW21029.1 single-stranded DNA-binding protein [Arcanobacterium bovis]
MTEEELEMDEVLVPNLDEEGDFAADYLEELLDIADLDGDIEISVEADRASVAIVHEDGGDRRLKRLIGKRGESLDALQELTRLAVQSQTGMRSRLMLDVLGYREGHRKEIQEIAQEAVAKVLATGDDVALRPMNPFERKVVHDVVAAAGLFSDSSGFGAGRHVVISVPDEEDVEELDEEGFEDEEEFADGEE